MTIYITYVFNLIKEYTDVLDFVGTVFGLSTCHLGMRSFYQLQGIKLKHKSLSCVLTMSHFDA
jgi:hypothetical protein